MGPRPASEAVAMTEPMQSAEAETMLIGAAMAGCPDLDDLFATVERGDFYRPFHAEMWDAIQRVHNGGQRPEPLSVRAALAEAGVKFNPVAIFDFTEACPMPAHGPYYAAQVAQAAGLRAIQDAGTRIQQIGSDAGDLDIRREEARQVVDEATRGRSAHKARTMAQILPGVIDTAQHGAASMLGTGWPDLDRLIGGLAPGRLVLVGARPGVGKSVMGTNLALHFAHHHQHAVLLSSMEMPESEVGQRLLAAHAEVNLTALQTGLTDERAWQRIAERSSHLEALPITIDDTPAQTVTSMRRAARNVQRTRDDLALIVVDYLQLVAPSNARANRSEQVTEISRGLKILARETGACVVAMAQVNREGAKNHDGRPRLTDLREGGIENDADQVLLLHQPDDGVPEIEVNVEKNRHGPRGQATLQMQGHYARLSSIAWSPTRAIA
jgi:replicative DNA helicase